jgi:hypothetical protein
MDSHPGQLPLATSIVHADDLPLIIAEWEQLSREEPWHIDPHRYGIDSLHEAIAAVLEVATWGGTGSFTAERLVRSAAAHGEQRRAQGVNDEALFREYHALRAALWRFLQRSPRHHAGAIAEILRVDVAIGVATTIALRGYHRADMAHGTVWEKDVLEQIAAVSRHLADLLHQDAQA